MIKSFFFQHKKWILLVLAAVLFGIAFFAFQSRERPAETVDAISDISKPDSVRFEALKNMSPEEQKARLGNELATWLKSGNKLLAIGAIEAMAHDSSLETREKLWNVVESFDNEDLVRVALDSLMSPNHIQGYQRTYEKLLTRQNAFSLQVQVLSKMYADPTLNSLVNADWLKEKLSDLKPHTPQEQKLLEELLGPYQTKAEKPL